MFSNTHKSWGILHEFKDPVYNLGLHQFQFLEIHNNRVHAKPILHQCTFCNKGFKDKSNWTKHLRVEGNVVGNNKPTNRLITKPVP